MLQFSDEDSASFLEDDLISPSRVEGGQLLGDAIVFTHPQGVHQSQLRLFSGSGISGIEARFGGASGWNGQQWPTGNVGHFELTPSERAKRRSGGVGTAVNGRCIQPVGNLIQLIKAFSIKLISGNLIEWNVPRLPDQRIRGCSCSSLRRWFEQSSCKSFWPWSWRRKDR